MQASVFVETISVSLQVLADSTPELTKAYRFQLEAISGGARLDSNPEATVSTLIVTASDNPHGKIQFAVSQTRVSESVGKVSVAAVVLLCLIINFLYLNVPRCLC